MELSLAAAFRVGTHAWGQGCWLSLWTLPSGELARILIRSKLPVMLDFEVSIALAMAKAATVFVVSSTLVSFRAMQARQ